MRRLLLPAFLLIGFAACSSPTGPDDPAQLLEQNRALWARAGYPSYRFTVVRNCFCLQEETGPVLIEVRDGQVVDRRYEGGLAVSPQFHTYFPSVGGLFDLIGEAVAWPAASVVVRYHRTLGYPESIAIDWVAGAVDDEVGYRISELAELR